MAAPRPGIAFFDFDNTLIQGDIAPLYGSYLVNARHRAVAQKRGTKQADRDRARLYARYLPYLTWLSLQAALYKTRAVRRSSLVRSAYRALRGVRADHYYRHMADFVDAEVPGRIYPAVRAIIAEHRAAGRPVVIITTGVEELVRHCLRHFPSGIELIGCRLGERDGRLTGRVDGPLYGADKANILRAYSRAAGVALADCWAYSDHYSDKHMLEEVGHPVAVNPRGRLLRLAVDRKWQVLRPVVGEP